MEFAQLNTHTHTHTLVVRCRVCSVHVGLVRGEEMTLLARYIERASVCRSSTKAKKNPMHGI